MSTLRPALVLLALGLVVACDDGRRQQLEDELMLMQDRLIELETQVADAQARSSRLSTAVSQLEAYVADVETEVIDLSSIVSRDLLVNVEATVGNAKTKLSEVRARTDALGSGLRPFYPEE